MVGDEPMYENAITWRWRATRRAAGLPKVRLHDRRHFYASGLIAAGCDVVTVQQALGHSTASTTLNTYSLSADRRGPNPRCGFRSRWCRAFGGRSGNRTNGWSPSAEACHDC